jgi:putative membrane protein
MTLRYEFEESGLRMRVGMLFRNETITAYRRIQDIHLTSNVLQRWLGIASISIQTASASMAPEIVIEGVSEPEKLRDWLYQRLRGTQPVDAVVAVSENDSENASLVNDEVTQLLTEIRDNLARLVDRDSRGGS